MGEDKVIQRLFIADATAATAADVLYWRCIFLIVSDMLCIIYPVDFVLTIVYLFIR